MTPGPILEVLRRAVDGVGDRFDIEDGRAAVDIAESAGSLGFVVIDVRTDDRLAAFALGQLWCAVDAVAPVIDVPPLSAVNVAPHTVQWMLRSLEAHLTALARDAPVLVLMREREAMDPVTQDVIDVFAAMTADRPVVWAIGRRVGSPPHRSVDEAVRRVGEAGEVITTILAASDLALTEQELSTLSGLVPSSLRSTLDDLIARGDVGECRGHFALAPGWTAGPHPLPAPLARGIRRGVLDVLVNRAVDPVFLAEMALDSFHPDDRVAARVLADAMSELAGSDPDAAARYGLGAVKMLADTGEVLTALTWQLLPLLWRTGRADEARTLARRVFSDRGAQDAQAQSLLWLARFEGSASRALEYTTRALAIQGIPLPIRTSLLGVHLRLLSTLGLSTEVSRLLPAAMADARAAENDEVLSRLVSCASIQHFYRGEYSQAIALLEEADALWARSGVDVAERMPELIWAPHLRLVLGARERSEREIDALTHLMSDRRHVFATRFLHSERALAHLLAGELAEASDEAVLATTASEMHWSLSPGAEDRLQAIALSVRLKVALHRGDAGELDDLRGRLVDSAPLGSEAWARTRWWQFLLDDAQGRTSPEDRSVDPDQLPVVSWLDPADEVLIGRVLLMHGYRDAAERIRIAAEERVVISGGHPLARVIADHLAGLCDWSVGPLLRAAVGWADLGRPLTALSAQSDAAARRSEDGERSALNTLEDVHDSLIAVGAKRDAWRVRWYLRSAGIHLPGERGSDRTVLTPTERRVVARAVLGETVGRIADALLVSPHTVTTHLRHVYAKTGVASRDELIQWARTTPHGWEIDGS